MSRVVGSSLLLKSMKGSRRERGVELLESDHST